MSQASTLKLQLAITEMEQVWYEKLKAKLNKIEKGEMTLPEYQSEILNKVFDRKNLVHKLKLEIEQAEKTLKGNTNFDPAL